jgi:hypothetical protein
VSQPPHDPKIDYANSHTTDATIKRSAGNWAKLLAVWAVGIIVWTIYLIVIGFIVMHLL